MSKATLGDFAELVLKHMCDKCINYSPRIEGKDKGQQIADQNNERFGKFKGDNEHCIECGEAVGTLRLSLNHLCESCEAEEVLEQQMENLRQDYNDGRAAEAEELKKDWYKKEVTLTREQADAVMELYYPSWGFYCEDGKKSGEVLRYVLESMIDEEEQNE